MRRFPTQTPSRCPACEQGLVLPNRISPVAVNLRCPHCRVLLTVQVGRTESVVNRASTYSSPKTTGV